MDSCYLRDTQRAHRRRNDRHDIDAQIAGGLADIQAGRVRGSFASHKEFIASLHKETKKVNRKKAKRSA